MKLTLALAHTSLIEPQTRLQKGCYIIAIAIMYQKHQVIKRFKCEAMLKMYIMFGSCCFVFPYLLPFLTKETSTVPTKIVQDANVAYLRRGLSPPLLW